MSNRLKKSRRNMTECILWNFFVRFPHIVYALSFFVSGLFKDYSTLGVRYWDLQARVYKQGTRN